MKKFVFGLCAFLIPAFGSNTACPQLTPSASGLGCSSVDSTFVSVSTSTISYSPDLSVVSTETPSYSSAMIPALTYSSVVEPTITVLPSEGTSSASLSAVSVLTSGSYPAGLLSSSPIALPSQFLESLLNGSSLSPTNSFSPSAVGAPEASSVAMIGTGLLILSLAAASSRKRRAKG